jgi:hypothetical protein
VNGGGEVGIELDELGVARIRAVAIRAQVQPLGSILGVPLCLTLVAGETDETRGAPASVSCAARINA